MDEGCAVAAGRSFSRAASTARRFSSKNEGSFIARGNWRATSGQSASRFGLPLRIERLGGELAVGFLEENFHSPLGLFELLLAFSRKRDAFFEQLHGVVQRKLRTLEAADDFLEAGERTLKIRLLLRFRFLGSR